MRSRGVTRLAARAAICVLTSLFIALPAPASADPEPSVTGPLRYEDGTCDAGKLTSNDETIAKFEFCIGLYTFDPLMETDLMRDYGVAWVQATVDPVRGWCAKSVRSEIRLPDDVETHARAPSRALSTRRPKRVKVNLKVDAEDHALEEGRISQRLTLYPRKVTPQTEDGGKLLRLLWQGRESSPISFATGVEMSWETLSSVEGIRGGLGRMNFVKSDRC